MADVFVSYTAADRPWAFWIAKELQALGHVPHVHEWEIAGGVDIYGWMESRHDAADHVLCVVSDAYLKAPYSTLERNAALWQAAARRPSFILFVAVEPCRFPTLSDHMRRCELFGVPEDAARLRFRDFMAERGAPDKAAFPGTVVAVSNIPIRVPTHFMGRDDSLAAIGAALGRYQGRVAITALHGLRGVGKTTLAAAFAERHRRDYRATWWIRAQTEPTMRADLVALGVRLGWVGAEDKEEPALATVAERLRHEGEGILLIYDNAVEARDLKPYLPRGGAAQVLVTSNAHAWRGVAEPVEIRLWPAVVGADYLVARTGRGTERVAAEALSAALGGLPLAHEQAAAYCERLDIGLADYAKRFAAAPARLLDGARDAPAEYHDGLTVAKTFALAIAEAAKLHPAAEPLIVHAALLAPEPMPLFLFAEGREALGGPLASLLAEDGLDEAVAALRTFALVDRETIPDERDPGITTDCIRLHRLVREVAAGRCGEEERDIMRRGLVKALAATYPGDIWNSPAVWPRARRLDAITIALVGGDVSFLDEAETQAADLLDRIALYWQNALGDYVSARPLAERSLEIREKMLGPHHPNTATSLDICAILLQAQGDFAGARTLFERALAVYETAFGPNHPNVAASLSSIGYLIYSRGDFAGARPLFERALTINEKALGSSHPSTATALNNLACLLRDNHQPRDAEWLFRKAIVAGETSLGRRHPDVATRLSNLACLLRDTDCAAEAEPLFLEAIEIGTGRLGGDHPLTRRYQSHHARLLLQTNRAAEALALGEAALAVHEAASGPDHPWTKDSARVTADALEALGRDDEAAALRARYGLG